MNMCVVALLHSIMINHEEDRNIQNPPYGEEITSICMIVKTSNNTNVGVVVLLHCITKNHEEMTNIHTGCRRPIGCLIFIGHIPQKSLTLVALLQKETCKLRQSLHLRHPVVLRLMQNSKIFITARKSNEIHSDDNRNHSDNDEEYAHIYKHIGVYMFIYVYTYTYMYTYGCVYTYIYDRNHGDNDEDVVLSYACWTCLVHMKDMTHSYV